MAIGAVEMLRPPTAAPTPVAPHLDSSTAPSLRMKQSSKPSPPYFSSMPKPKKPSAPSFSWISHGIAPASSHASTWGLISAATNFAIVSR